jgi:hypothetical protein
VHSLSKENKELRPLNAELRKLMLSSPLAKPVPRTGTARR